MGTACCGPAFCALGCGLWPTLAMSRFVSELQSPGKRWLVAGLGNPGLPGTRHSVGLAVLGQLARRLGVAESWVRDSSCAADLVLAPLGDAQLVLLRPRRLMNANGRSVARAAELFGLTAEEVYLVHDELDKPLGKLALKLGGSARQCQGCGWASVALCTLAQWRATSLATSPLRNRSCCLRCWRVPLTCSWTTSRIGARRPHPVPDTSALGCCLIAAAADSAMAIKPPCPLRGSIFYRGSTLLWAAPGLLQIPGGTVAKTVPFWGRVGLVSPGATWDAGKLQEH
ncbi:probable peptidyl-tRNA hydrolase isoform X4 [Heterocephalus glaber]|uniref:Probable peptidyl-tRNA hydrolase isoform X4 n=1 Tax=Heterocephalus glaber TaxID=10181 RepID=A0AAX6TA87_HETGA|nr:probable peptidyl-tRNA hydrolase isoform X4 [Heterocephalus glaber]